MNCKQGDLAIVVHSVAGNEGKIVRCVSLYVHVTDPAWKTEPVLLKLDGSPFEGVLDSALRPLRGLPETETTEQEQPCTTTA